MPAKKQSTFIYAPVVFLVFCVLRSLRKEEGWTIIFFIPKIRDLHYSLIPPCSSPSIFSVTFACRANWFLILVQRLATACDDFTTTPGIRYSPTATLPFISANGPLPGLIVAPLESFGRYRLSRLRSLRSLHSGYGYSPPSCSGKRQSRASPRSPRWRF